MGFWDNQRITVGGTPLKAGLQTSIAFGETKKNLKNNNNKALDPHNYYK